ncbi:MAG: hypothetical protein E7324_01390, partial [Clostridiales bacterium]|nr:hypothetical protein [Clostridiales bacterium]
STATPVPTQTPAPTEPPFIPQDARITVLYLSMNDGLPVAMNNQVPCAPGQSVEIFPTPENLLPGYVLVSEPSITVDVNNMGQPNMSEVVFLYQYVEPEGNDPVIENVNITVRYYSLDMQQVASPTRFTCVPGVNYVQAAPYDLQSGYELVGDNIQYITLDEYGVTASEVIFYYQKVYQPTPAPASVQVLYLSRDNSPVAKEQWIVCPYGQDTVIYAKPENLTADYVLDGEGYQVVRVDDNGPSAAQVIFYYRYSPNVPAPKIALVPVRYVAPDGESTFYTYTETCVEGVNYAIKVDMSRVPAGYELASPEEVWVTVDANGAANPNEVVFRFRNEVNVYVTVYFLDHEGRHVASPQQVLCYVGPNGIQAQPLDLQPGYALAGENTQYVTLSQDGTLTPEQVVFRYQYIATPLPGTPTPFPYSYEPNDWYCYPKSDNINFRSEPSTALDTSIIATVNRSNLAHILGRVRNHQNEIWYHVEIAGQTGFLKETVVRLLTEAEIAALFNYTVAPTQVPTPAPTPVPDGAPIDRWALTNAGGLNFRRTPATGNNVIRQVSKNTRTWIYSSLTVDGTKWYHVQINGIEGYLMAKFLDIYSQQESESIQQQLPSPMPTQTPPYIPTPAPTQAPTLVPTLIPTQIPTLAPTQTPAPYRGYAATRWQEMLRTGVSNSDENVLEILTADSLVYVEGQTYVNGVVYSSVQNQRTGAWGFMPNDCLRPISGEEARIYLDRIHAQATATPEPQQIYGYAMTVGDRVPMRTFPDVSGEIQQLLPYGAVVSVQGQIYDAQNAWHLVQHNGMWGYIRQDQVRILSQAEADAYEESLRGTAPTATPAPTPAIQDPYNSPSSYGVVKSNSGKVNLRSQPSVDSQRIRLLENGAFSLVLGTVYDENGKPWYHVNQAGTEGYISGEYFKVFTQAELNDYFQSEEFLNSGVNSNVNSGDQLQSWEDYNQQIWQNPALSTSYEPFNPYLTPSPNPEMLPTATPAPTRTPLPSPTAYLAPIGPLGSWTANPPSANTQEQSFPWGLIVVLIVLACGGTAVYAYAVHRKNEQRRRQAMRAQQARQNRAVTANQQPQMRSAPNNPQARAYQPTAAYRPPQSASQQTGRFPVTNGSAPAAPQQTIRTPVSLGKAPDAAPQQTGRIPVQATRVNPPAPGVPATTNPFRPVTQRQADAYRASLEARARQNAPLRAPDPSDPTPAPRQETQRYAGTPAASAQPSAPAADAPVRRRRAAQSADQNPDNQA